MKLVFCATCESIPNLTADDQALIAPLAKLGIEARPAIWSDAKVNWAEAQAVILRSTWDYHLRLEEFLAWMTSLEETGARVFNPPTMLCWNADKIYLRDLERKGVAIVPTLWPEKGFQLQQELRKYSRTKAVIKPRVSATAYRTVLTSAGETNEAQALADDLLRGPGVMVQEYMNEVSTRGEWSLIFFSGEFSHAVLKIPKAGDFRVQHDFGGAERTAKAPDAVIQAASRAIAALENVPLYARVDGVESGGEFLLMELELIEPALFLRLGEGAAERFATAIAARCR